MNMLVSKSNCCKKYLYTMYCVEINVSMFQARVYWLRGIIVPWLNCSMVAGEAKATKERLAPQENSATMSLA